MEKSRPFSRSMGRWLMTLLLVMLTSLAARAVEAYACYTPENTTLTFYYDNYRSSQSGTTYSLNTGNNDPGWYTDRTCNEVTRVTFTFSFANAHPTTTYRWFCGMTNLETITGISELNTSDVTNMGDMFNGCGLENIDLSNFNTAKVTDMSYMFYNCTHLKQLFLNNFNTARVTNMSGMFGLCTSLTLLDLRYLNTSQVTDMSNMFYNCSHLKNLHLSTLNTANVTDMSNMFYNCDELETLNLSSFNTANVTDMRNMFNGCSSLTSLDLSSFNTANVTNMSYMFTGCWRLDNLDLSSFNTANVTNMRGMFSGCSSLHTIYVGNEWSTANVTESGSMFYSCYYLQGGAGTAFDESNPTDKTYAHIDGGSSNPGYLTAAAEAYVEYYAEGETLVFHYDRDRHNYPSTASLYLGDKEENPSRYEEPINWDELQSWGPIKHVYFMPSFADARPKSTHNWFEGLSQLEDITGMNLYLNTSQVNDMSSMFMDCSALTSLDLSGFNTANVTEMSFMFFSCTGLTSLDLSSFNTENVKYMYRMFENCTSLRNLDVSSFNTPNAIILEDMFYGCENLTELDLSGFNTANVTNMSGMFYACMKLSSLDLSNFNTANVTNMSSMFYACMELSRLDLSNFNTAKVTNMSHMFYGCGYLESLDLSSFNTANVTNMGSMFGDCNELESLNISSFNTAKVTNMSDMFYACMALESLDLSNFNTANVTNMQGMFHESPNLTYLDLSSFNTANVTDMSHMFYECYNLHTIYAGSGWSTAAVTSSSNMFENCNNLVGGRGTTYDANHTDKAYAHIDGGSSNPGYLTGVIEPYAFYSSGDLVFCYDDMRGSHATTYDLPTGEEYPGWYEDGTYMSVRRAYFADSFAGYYPTSTYYWFAGMANLSYTTLSQTFGNLNTSEVRTMAGMFYGCSGLEYLDLSLFNTANVTDMSDMFFGCRSLTGIRLNSFNTSNVTNMGRMFNGCSELTSLSVDGFNTANVTNMASMFAECEKLTTLSVRNFNTENVTNMAEMFYFCSGLTSLDLSSFNTAKVVDMNDMFCGCSGLNRLDVSNFNTAKVTNMAAMFSNCTGLTTLNLSGFNTNKVTDMRGMFRFNENLTSIYVGSGWSTAAVTQSSNMFGDCFSIKGEKGTTYNASHIDKAYAHVDGGTSNPGYLCGRQPYAVYTPENMTLTFYYDNQRSSRTGTTYDLNTGDDSPDWHSYTSRSVTKVEFNSTFADARPTSTMGWFWNMFNLSTITGINNLNTSEVTNMSRMFEGCHGLFVLDLNDFNTAQVTDMSRMFYDCRTLRTINVGPGWTTDAVTASELMFMGCTNLAGCEGTFYSSSHTDKAYAHIDGGTSNPGYLSAPRGAYAVYTPENTTLTFYCDAFRATRAGTTYDLNEGYNDPAWYTDGTCSSVTRVVFDPSLGGGVITTTYSWFKSMRNLQTVPDMYNNSLFSDVENAAYMFKDCIRLDTINVKIANIDYSDKRLTDVRGMFSGCTGLKSLRFLYDSEAVTNLDSLFYGCSSLTSLDLNNCNTSNVTSMASMFQGCTDLKSLDVHNLNTSKVTNMSRMFRECTDLTSIDLSGFNTAKVENMSQMFNGCSQLQAIYVGNGWSTAAVSNSAGMFTGCTNLVGSEGTTYSASHVNKDYAHIDGGPSNPGYLSQALPKAYAVYTSDNTTLSFYYDALWETRPGEVFEVTSDGRTWDDVAYQVTHVEFMPSFAEARPTSTRGWFFDMMSLESITGMEYLNTEWVTDMSMMFIYCTSLESLDLSSFNTANVTYMDGMFAYCEHLQAIDLSSFNTANVTGMSQMFSGCISLTSLDLSSFNTAQVTDMSAMFDHCGNLSTINVGPGWSTTAVTSSYGMFEECARLKGGQGTAYNASHTDAAYAHVDGGASNPGYLSGKSAAYACFTEPDSTLTFYYDNQWPYRAGTTFDMNTGSDSPDWSQDPYSWLTAHVKFDPSYADARPTSTHGWFSDFVQTIEGLEYLNTSEVTDMSNMFVFMGLDNIDISHFNTSKVTNMTAMFAFTPVTTLDLSSWNTENVTNMSSMFYGCSNLTTIYASSEWSSAKVTESESMFTGCTSLVGGMGTTYDENHLGAEYAHLDGGPGNPGYFSEKVPEAYAVYTADNTTLAFYYDTDRSTREGTTYDMNTGNHQPDWVLDETYRSVTQVMIDPSFADARPTSTHSWFFCMENVTSIAGINYLNTTEVTDMAAMFMECNSLTSLDLSHFNTAKVTDMFNMFYGCSNLTNVDLSSFNTAKVRDMRGMFRYCSMLTSLDLSSFNTAIVGHMGMMFLEDSNLSTIYVGSGWSTASINYSSEMFTGCTSLVGGMGTTYDPSHVDKAYARIDGGTSNPGYFTGKSAFQRGDVNGDGDIDVADVTTLIAIILNSQPVDHAIADMNNDNEIDVADVTTLISIILGQ